MTARGTIVGLTRFATRAHLVRATLEAIAFQSREVLEAMASDSGRPPESLKVDGGATENNFLMQLQADVLGIPVVRPAVRETTALGAAQAAGLACGAYGSLAELSQPLARRPDLRAGVERRPPRGVLPRLDQGRPPLPRLARDPTAEGQTVASPHRQPGLIHRKC